MGGLRKNVWKVFVCVHREQQHQRMSQFIYLRIAIYVGTHVPTILSHCVPTEPVMHFPACGGWMAGWLDRWLVRGMGNGKGIPRLLAPSKPQWMVSRVESGRGLQKEGLAELS